MSVQMYRRYCRLTSSCQPWNQRNSLADGFGSGGRRPERSLAAYGAFVRAGLPSSNEQVRLAAGLTHVIAFAADARVAPPLQGDVCVLGIMHAAHPINLTRTALATALPNLQGLRMLIGAAVREGAVRGLRVMPVFSLYSFHGPVFRAMLRVTRSAKWPHEDYGFIGAATRRMRLQGIHRGHVCTLQAAANHDRSQEFQECGGAGSTAAAWCGGLAIFCKLIDARRGSHIQGDAFLEV